ncbi:P3 [Setosphaeria turcica chrysovirus 1]|nr:P3 [Setosphaeria turcica chrysovirus 1]
MSFVSDPARPWCSLALSQLRTQVVSVQVPLRGRVEQGLSTHGDSVAGLAAFIEGEQPYLLQEEAVAHAIEDGCVASVSSLSDANGSMGLDGAATLVATVPYDMTLKDTRAALVTEGRFFRVAPSVHQDSLATMMMCNSVEEFAKTVAMKLPRITSSAMPTTGAGAAYYNQFEQLRLAVAKDAGQSDYGVRLHNLARVVCHAAVRRHMSESPRRTVMMGKGNMRSLVTAEMPTITAAEFRSDCWLYVKDEMDPRYRAFLTMGARGLHHFVSPGQETVYSRLQSEPEVISQRITFVRLCGEFTPVVPDAGAYVSVLGSLPLALSYYYAYANSLGLGHQATQVLLQCSLAPHVWGATAALPYRASHPRLDAATYLLRADQVAPDVQCPGQVGRVIDSSPLLAYRVLAGLGALLTGFTAGRMVDLSEVLSQVAGVIAEQGQARALVAQVLRASCSGYAALEWINPFSMDPRDGFRRVVSAYRTGLQLLGQCRAAPIATLKPLFEDGVDMRDAMLASPFKASGMAGYVESVVYQLLAGVPVKCASEADTPGSFGPRPAELGMVRSWRAVVTWVRYRRAARKRRATSDSSSSKAHSPRAEPVVAAPGGGPPGPGPLMFLQRAPETSDRMSFSSGSTGPPLPGPWLARGRSSSVGESSYTRTVRGGDQEPTLPARIPLPVRVSVDLGVLDREGKAGASPLVRESAERSEEPSAPRPPPPDPPLASQPAQVSPNSLGLV